MKGRCLWCGEEGAFVWAGRDKGFYHPDCWKQKLSGAPNPRITRDSTDDEDIGVEVMPILMKSPPKTVVTQDEQEEVLSAAKKIIDSGPTLPTIDPKVIVDALGAEEVKPDEFVIYRVGKWQPETESDEDE